MNVKTEKSNITFLDILGILNKEKWIIIIITALGSIGVFLYALISILLPPEKSYLPDYYIPQAHAVINESGGGGLTDMLKSTGLGDLADIAGLGKTGSTAFGLAQRIVKTNTFLDTMAEDFDFYNRYNLLESATPNTSARGMLGGLTVTSDVAAGMITVSFASADKEMATQIVNRAIELLDEQFGMIAMDRNRTQLTLIEKKLFEVEAEMLRLQKEIENLQQKYSTFDLAVLAKEQANTLSSLRARLLEKNLEIESYARAVGIEDPVFRKLKVERDSLRASIEKLENGYNEDGLIVPSAKELPDLVMGYTRLRNDLEVQRKIYETLVQQNELVKLQVESIPPTFQIYERATVPELKAGPGRRKICMVVAGASFLFSILLALIVDYIKRVIKDPQSIRKLKGIPDDS